jgi:dienelactone hydrolase
VTIQTRTIDYTQDGDTFEGFLAWDDSASGARPGVVISHAWGGAGEFEQERAQDIAKLGYVGFALDLYGKGIRGSDPEENAKLMQPFLGDRALLQKRMHLAVDTIRAQDEVDASKVAAMGYCFGGLCALDLARTGSDVLGVASFHGLFVPPGNTEGNKVTAKVIAFHGWNDPLAPPEQVLGLATEMTAAGADWQLHAFGSTLHAFTHPQANDPANGFAYSESATQRSMKMLADFLAEIF